MQERMAVSCVICPSILNAGLFKRSSSMTYLTLLFHFTTALVDLWSGFCAVSLIDWRSWAHDVRATERRLNECWLLGVAANFEFWYEFAIRRVCSKRLFNCEILSCKVFSSFDASETADRNVVVDFRRPPAKSTSWTTVAAEPTVAANSMISTSKGTEIGRRTTVVDSRDIRRLHLLLFQILWQCLQASFTSDRSNTEGIWPITGGYLYTAAKWLISEFPSTFS